MNEKEYAPPINRLELDTAATMFPLAFCKKHKSLIRLTVTMSDPIDRNSLQSALDRLMPRFPSFYVRLSHNRFRYFFESLDYTPVILEEARANDPLFMTLDELYTCAFRVVVAENRIALEYSHAVSDGYGGSVFLKSLIAEYLNIRYSVSGFPGVLCVKEASTYDEIKDEYPKIAGVANKLKDFPSAYSLKGTPDEKLHITELTFKTEALLNCASEHGVTLTAFLSGILVAALTDVRWYKNKKQQEVRLSIPIDLRRRFSSCTLRNFTVPITIYAGNVSEKTDISALCQSIHKQLKRSTNKENLSAMVAMYVKMAKSRVISAMPLSLKRWGVQTFFSLRKVESCMTFSNLGIWRLPDEMEPYVKQSGMMFSPKPSSPYSCGVVSVGNTLTLTLTRSIKEPLLEQRVLRILENTIYKKNIRLESV
ncbi:hypothetical protein KDC22_23965 [Paenibacillus tritici]|uniref:phthiocerol/phthiodiolone dimycocerosyl transferase family protein n=1 Tax=Paenibacillus tritici TaxID=1873425 RepID=UPI001BA713A2|nr:hypothetical protein [Paenibacillus tritici]QUL53425.1 hypothetical protein KDC22_23965 [Paenibacillus tritici]